MHIQGGNSTQIKNENRVRMHFDFCPLLTESSANPPTDMHFLPLTASELL
uniref:Uncharacterized protein n=1 Tax=Anguilla anguilla TaxID=7936 RepID=A0A0E9S2R1_ANGAN